MIEGVGLIREGSDVCASTAGIKIQDRRARRVKQPHGWARLAQRELIDPGPGNREVALAREAEKLTRSPRSPWTMGKIR